jgi:predicted dehydrogenase
MTRVGIIGYGYWGPRLARNFNSIEECEVAAIADMNPDRLEHARVHYRASEALSDASALLDRDDIDAVAIATPVASHHALAQEALSKGKHVLIEKPMTRTAAEGRELIDLARETGLKLMVDHTFVYTGAVQKLREFVNAGELGDLFYFDSVRVNLGLFQHDVNVIWDLAPHDFSIMSHLVDERPVSVSAVGASHIDYTDRPLENIAYVTVNFDSGLIAHFHVNWLTPVKVRKMLIGGSKKMVVYDDLEPDEKIKLYDKGVAIETPEEAYEALVQYRIGDAYMPVVPRHEALNVECRHFLRCIVNDEQPLTDGEAGLEVVRLLEATDRSLKEHGKAIRLERPSAVVA